MASIGSAFKAFWHTMTSTDRHASYNSPFRTGQHVPLPQSHHAPLTSVATNGFESSADLTSTQSGESADSPANPYFNAEPGSQSPSGPYSPGMRSNMQRKRSDDPPKTLARSSTGEIQMQNFSNGLPPPPPVGHSWGKIDSWVENNFEELFDNLSEGCTQNDINELEHELNCTLPQDVRDSLQIHDGQERGGLPTGIIFGNMLLDCEEIVHEWKNWKIVNEELAAQPSRRQSEPIPSKAFDGAPSSSTSPPPPTPQTANPNWREDLLARQDSQPTGAIQKAYASSSWIPLVRDWGGNNLAVDLAPGPAGQWGQIILFGRDYDCKFVIARSWASFLAMVADDINSGRAVIKEESNELILKQFKDVEPPYLGILRWRSDQKHGRKPPRRKSANGDIRINSNVAQSMSRVSPYASPVVADGDRGRSPQRYGGKGIATASPRATGISSPLARVAEEAPGTKSEAEAIRSSLSKMTPSTSTSTPRGSQDTPQNSTPEKPGLKSNDHIDGQLLSSQGLTVQAEKDTQPRPSSEDLKTVDI